MASREYYSEIIDEMRKAQGKLTTALYSDLDRLASAESNSAKAKAEQAYERGVNEAFDVIVALFDMHPLDLQEYLKAYELDDMEQFLKSGNRVERVKQVQHTVKVVRSSELKVGDEVTYESPMNAIKGIVIWKNTENGSLMVFDTKTLKTFIIHGSAVKKTGRHFDATEIEKAIEEVRGRRRPNNADRNK